MKIEEQVLSREQMAHLVELGVDTSDASMIWVVNKENPSIVSIDINDPLPYVGNCACDFIPTYTIGDLIGKLPKEFRFVSSCKSYTFIKEGNPVIFRHELIHTQNANLKDDLYAALCMIAIYHKELIK